MAELENTESTETTEETDEKPGKVIPGKDEAAGDDEEGEGEEDAEELEDAKRLYKALRNPETSERTIRLLASDLGLEFGTKAEKKEAKDAILDVLEEKLGQYKFLAPGLKDAFTQILADHDKKTNARFEDLQRQEIVKASDTAVQEMLKDPEFEKVYPRVMKLMEEVHPAHNVPPKAHLKRLFAIAKDEAAEKAKSSSKSDKLKKSIRDIPGKLKDASVGGEDKNFRKDRPLTRREAIKETLEELESGA